MSLPLATRVQWDAMKGYDFVVVTGEVVESRFSSSPSSQWSLCRIAGTNDTVEIRDENLRVIDAICAGCFARVRPGVNTDHLKGCPTGQNGTPNYE